MKTNPIISTQTFVESPFIIVKIGNYTFGDVQKKTGKNVLNVSFPNYMKSIQIGKVNGQVNQYTITMLYQIQAGDDPNKLEKVFGSVSDSRKITLSYGDWNEPTNIYREEEAIITTVTQNVDFGSSAITYTINAVGASVTLTQSYHDFPKRTTKPSTVMKEMLKNKKFGLTDIFTGMRDKSKLQQANLIKADDQVVTIEAKQNMGTLDYLNYLCNCMTPIDDTDNKGLKNAFYALNIRDDTKNEMGGPFFEVKKVTNDVGNAKKNSYDTYSIDVGYPGDNFVSAFNIQNNEVWSLLYKYSQDISKDEYQYRLDDSGKWVSEYSPRITSNNKLKKTTSASKTWWTKVTNYPIQATITIKGLIRPSILMTYIDLNTYFYGEKHISSGLYIITKQNDQIDSSGYKTTLTLLKLKGTD